MRLPLTALLNPLRLALAGLAFCALNGCASMAQYTELPSGETNAVAADVDLIHDTMDEVKDDSGKIGEIPADVDMSTVNPSKLKKAMNDCFAEPIAEVKKMGKDAKKTAGKAAAGKVDRAAGEAKGKQTVKKGKKVYAQFRDCALRRKDKAVQLKELAPGGKSDFVKAKLDLVDHLRKSIHFLTQKSKDMPSILKNLAEIKAKNEAAHAATQKNPLTNGADKKKNDAEYKKLDKQIDQMIATLKKDMTHLPGDLVKIGNQVKNDLANFGGK